MPTTQDSAPARHVDCVVGVTNFGRGVSTPHLVSNLKTLSHCDVICVSEPGSSYRSGTQNGIAIADFEYIHATRGLDHQYAGILLLVRKSKLVVSHAETFSAGALQIASCIVHRPDENGATSPVCVVMGVYATCSRDYAADANTLVQLLSDRKQFVCSFAPAGTPLIVMGDFNAHHPSFGDDTGTCDARGKALHEWALQHSLQVVGLPTRGNAALDIVLCTAALPVCTPAVRKVLGTDHDKALTVDIDPCPSSDAVYFEHRAVRPSTVDDALFLATLERVLRAGSSAPSPRDRDFRIIAALREAMVAVGFAFRRCPVNPRTTPPTIQQILSAAHRSVWSAIRLLRRPSRRLECDVESDDVLRCFGSAGKQRDHHDAPLVRGAPATFTPVCREEVAAAIRRHNPRACPDSNGFDGAILRLAAKSTLFLTFFADMLSDCLRLGTVPARWNCCDITPIPKPGRDPSVVANLRPIYLINMIAKTADRVFDTRCRARFTPHPQQFGYRQGVPIDAVPLAALEMCCQGQTEQDPRGPVACLVIAADIADGFPGAAARGIMDGYGDLPEDLRQVKVAMLTNRRVRVRHRGQVSAWDDIRDGTNQGFVSGPVDFSAFSSTLLQRLEVWSKTRGATKHFAMVADDLNATIVGVRAEIQAAADAFFKVLGDWLGEYEMRLSPKTKAVVVTPTTAPTRRGWSMRFTCNGVTVHTQYSSEHGALPLLGYRFDPKLTLNAAVGYALSKHDQALHTIAPLLGVASMQDRAAVYDSLALSHIRRVSVVVLCARGLESRHWDALNQAIASGARMITGTTATASNALVILEAGFSDARAIAVSEATRLSAKLRALDFSSPTINHALAFLARSGKMRQLPEKTTGIVRDRPLVDPSLARFRSFVVVDPTPHLTETEAFIMRRDAPDDDDALFDDGRPEPEHVRLVKRAANQRVRLWAKRAMARGAFVFFSDGSVIKSRRSGAGACVMFARGREEFACRSACGTHCCSFSAEATGFSCFRRLVAQLARSGQIPRGSSVVVLSDSKSYLDALATGPLDQRDKRLADLWQFLLETARDFDLVFLFRFIYGHTGWPEADRADEEAREGARLAPRVGQCTWWKDCSRAAVHTPVDTILRKSVEGTFRDRVRRKQRGNRRLPDHLPSRWPSKRFARWTNFEKTTLCQLRTNACPKLGGHLHGHVHHCVRCGAWTRRDNYGNSMVEHAFRCPRVRSKRRQFHVRDIVDLWRRPRACIDYIRETFFEYRVLSPYDPP